MQPSDDGIIYIRFHIKRNKIFDDVKIEEHKDAGDLGFVKTV